METSLGRATDSGGDVVMKMEFGGGGVGRECMEVEATVASCWAEGSGEEDDVVIGYDG